MRGLGQPGALDGRAVVRTLLAQVLGAFLPAGEVVVSADDTIERRWRHHFKSF